MALVMIGHGLAVIPADIAVVRPGYRDCPGNFLHRIDMYDRKCVLHPVGVVDMNDISVLVPEDQDRPKGMVDTEVDSPNLEPERRDIQRRDRLLHDAFLRCREDPARALHRNAKRAGFQLMREITAQHLLLSFRAQMRGLVDGDCRHAPIVRRLIQKPVHDNRAPIQRGKGQPAEPPTLTYSGQGLAINVLRRFLIKPKPVQTLSLELGSALFKRLERRGRYPTGDVPNLYRVVSVGNATGEGRLFNEQL